MRKSLFLWSWSRCASATLLLSSALAWVISLAEPVAAQEAAEPVPEQEAGDSVPAQEAAEPIAVEEEAAAPEAPAPVSGAEIEAGPDPDRWVLQGGGRLFSGLGSTLGEAQGNDFITELGIRGEVLFGRPGNKHVRIGPALEFRTGHFHTVEVAGGAMALFPTAPGWPIQWSVLGGWAERFRFHPTRADGAVLVSTLAFGYRSYNYFARYGVGLNAYVSGRVHLDDPHAYEITGGIEFDLAMAYYVPIGLARMVVKERGQDPDEFIEAGEEEEE